MDESLVLLNKVSELEFLLSTNRCCYHLACPPASFFIAASSSSLFLRVIYTNPL